MKFRANNRFLIIILVLFTAWIGAVATVSANDEYPGLTLELVVEKPRFEIGEPIDITLRFLNTGERTLQVAHHTYDRSGRMTSFGFAVTNSAGILARDPIAGSLGDIGGGIFVYEPLPPRGRYEQTLTLNEWFCFEVPGTYVVRAHPGIVEVPTDESFARGTRVAVESKPLTIEIVPFDPQARKALLARLESQLSGSDNTTRRDAMRRLRFLVDERAIPLQVKGLSDSGLRSEADFGLSSYRGRAATRVKGEVLKLVEADKTSWNEGQLLWTYASLLGRADLLASGREMKFLDFRSEWRWRHRLSDIYFDNLEKLPLAEARERLRIAFRVGPIVPVAGRHWEFIATNASAIEPGGLDKAATVITNYFEEWRMRSDLRAIAANEKLPASVRNAASTAFAKVNTRWFLLKELRGKLADFVEMLPGLLVGALIGISLVLTAAFLILRRWRRAA